MLGMKRLSRFAFSLAAAAAITIVPSLAETNSRSSEDKGVQEAIACQRAKDRADAAQARKEARNPEHFTDAAPQHNQKNGLADQQKKEALKHTAKPAGQDRSPREQ